MKKVLIGCGIITLLLVVLVIGGFVYTGIKIKQVTDGYKVAAADIEKLDTTYPFATPADGALSQERLDSYFQVRDAMLAKVQANPTVQKIIDSKNGKTANIGFGEMLKLGTSFGRELMEGFAAELEKHKMSPAEFSFNTEAIYASINEGKKKADPILTEIYDKFDVAVDNISTAFKNQQGNQQQLNVSFGSTLSTLETQAADVLARNIELVKQHKDQLLDFPEVAYVELINLHARGAARTTMTPMDPIPVVPGPTPGMVEPVPATP